MSKNYDLVVVGAGPGGYVAAIKAAQKGLSVALIEQDKVGGTCLNRGCVPTKVLLHSSHLYAEIASASDLGIVAEHLSYDIKKMYAHKEDVVTQLRNGVEHLVKENKIDLLFGTAFLPEEHTVTVTGQEGAQTLTAKHILIATGSVPSRPPLSGLSLPNVLTSDELLQQEGTDYKKLVIIGGGVIGVEFATFFNSLGCKVTIIEAMGRILPTMEKEISQNLSMILKKRGVTIHTNAMVEKIEENSQGLTCHFTKKEQPEQVETEAVLVSIGRKANISGLFADTLAIKTERGIIVDEYFRTSIPHIYAIGDCISGGIQLAHVATAQGSNAVSHMVGETPEINLNLVPSCVYTNPEIASIGLTAVEAKEKGIPVVIGKFGMNGLAKSIIEKQDRGFIKLIFAEDTQILLGTQLMCARATDLISELTTAIENGLTAHQLSSVIRPHPTFTEGVTEAVESVFGTAVHIAPRK